MMKKATLTILLILFFQASFCQKNYLPGYIIPLKGDTIHGFVDYRNWEKNPDKIAFKEKSGDQPSAYTPLDIKEFGVLDEIYKGAVVETENSPFEIKDLRYDRELDIKTDTIFLQTLVKGEKSLYYYRNKAGKDQFYIKQDSSFNLLVYKKYLKDQDGRTTVLENKRFIGQLTIYFKDCSTIQSKLNDAEYQRNSLENLFLSYYKCTSSAIDFQKKTEKTKTEFGVLAGMSLTSLKFKSVDYIYLVNAGYPLSANFAAGLFFNVILPRNQGKWSVNNELIFTSYKVSGRYEVYENENKYTITSTTLGYSYLKLNTMIRFTYPVKKFFLFVNAGMSNGYAVIEKNYAKVESKLFTQVRVEEGKALNYTRRYELGFLLGVGVLVKKFSFDVRYERGNGMSDFVYLSSPVNRIYFLLGYRF